VEQNVGAIFSIPEQYQTEELWRIAVSGYGYALKFLPASFMSEEICRLAVSNFGEALKLVPEEFKTKEVFFAAVREDCHMLNYVDVGKLSKEEYTEICRLAFEGE